jgi:hypothetical protein
MSWSYTPGTFVFYVRSLIPDTQESAPIFSDEEINGFAQINSMTWQSSMFNSYQGGVINLPQTPSNIFRCAAIALNVLAGNASRLSAVTGLLDVKLNAQVGDQLRKQAQAWLDMDDNSGAFAIYEQCNTEWAFRDRWIAQLQRQTGGGSYA